MSAKKTSPQGPDARTQTGREATGRRERLRARQAAEARARQRRTRVLVVLCGVLVVAVIAVVGGVAWNLQQDKKERAEREAKAQLRPPHALPDGTGLVANPGTFAKDAPVLTIFEDYQCPGCKQAEDRYGQVVTELAKQGKVQLQFRTLTFLDDRYPGEHSQRAARAAACADVVGKLEPYHATVFAHQPEREGDGYTDDQLTKDFPQQAGITGDALAKFQTCYRDRQTAKWVSDSAVTGQQGFENQTPQHSLNGKNPDSRTNPRAKWWQELEPTTQAWEKAIVEYS